MFGSGTNADGFAPAPNTSCRILQELDVDESQAKRSTCSTLFSEAHPRASRRRLPVFTRPGPTPDVRTACATDQRMAVTANAQMSVLRGRTNETSTASALSRTRCANSIEV